MNQVDYSFKYNYIILGADGYYRVGYKDVIDLQNVNYFSDYYQGFDTPLKKLIVKCNFSKKLNYFVKTPFKGYVFPRLFPHSFDNENPICYLFSGQWHYVINSTYPNYVKQLDPRNKCVLFMQDLVCRNDYIKIDKIRDKMDLLLSYDKGDCEQYGLVYYPTPMSKNPLLTDNCEGKEKSDFYFCGKAKGRYEIVHKLYLELIKRGYTCDFNILEMPTDIEHLQGIHYLEKALDYKDNLLHVKNSRCVVEIMQDGADGYTPRLWESIISDKHLLTNNHVIVNSRYFNAENIHLFKNNFEHLDCSWLDQNALYPEDLKNSLSPINLLKFIDSHL